ncbi:S-layer homology domain-containing protein [Natronospora cellulosivora (SeqCode)]
MKKIVIALLLVLTLTVTTFAGSMTDVPSNHWAYDAVNTLVAAGLITGYPDGTFQGQNELSRYEISVIVARLLDNIEAEREAMLAEVGFNIRRAIHESDRGLSDAQGEQVLAIVEELMAANLPEVPEAEVDREDVLEVLAAIEDLSVEFENELKSQGIAVSVLVEEIRSLDDRVAALEAVEQATVSFSGTWGVEYEQFDAIGATPYADPYDRGYNDDNEDPDLIEGEDKLEQKIDLNMAVNNGPLALDVNLGASTNDFATRDDNFDGEIFNLDSFTAIVTGDDFVGTFANDQAPGLKSYLLHDSTNDDDDYNYPVNGVIVDAAGNTYALVHDGDNYILAGNGQFVLLGQDINVAFGTENFSDTRILAFDTALEVFGFDVDTELALNENNFDNKYFTVGANGEIATIELDLNYANIDGLQAIAGDNPDTLIGFDLTGKTSVLFANLEASYEAYEGEAWDYYEIEAIGSADSVMELKADMAEEFIGFDVSADYAYRTFAGFAEEANRTEWNVKAENEFGRLGFEANLNNVTETALYGDVMLATDLDDDDDYEGAEEFFNKSVKLSLPVTDNLATSSLFEFDNENELTSTFEANYEASRLAANAKVNMPGFGFGEANHEHNAEFTFNDALKAGAETEKENEGEWESKLYANFEQGILTADLTKYMNQEDDALVAEGTVRPNSVNLFDVTFSPYAEAGYRMASENAMNYAVGVDFEKALNDYATLTGNYEHADKNYGVDLAGVRIMTGLGVNYQITADLDASLNYEGLRFTDAENGDDNYRVRKATAGLDLAF